MVSLDLQSKAAKEDRYVRGYLKSLHGISRKWLSSKGSNRSPCCTERSHVQLYPLFPLGLVRPHDTTENRFDRRGGSHLGNGAEDVGKGAIPPLAQCLYGNDKAYLATWQIKVKTLQPLVSSGSPTNLLRRNIEIFNQALLNNLNGERLMRLAFGLCLNERDRPDILACRLMLFNGKLFKMFAASDGMASSSVVIEPCFGLSRQHSSAGVPWMNIIHKIYKQKLRGTFRGNARPFQEIEAAPIDQEPTELAALAVNVVLDEDSTVSTASYNLFASFCF